MMEKLMESERPESEPLDTMKVRGRLRGVWLALWLAGAAGCVLVGVYEDTPEPGSDAWWLPLSLSLAAVVVVARGAPLRAGTRC